MHKVSVCTPKLYFMLTPDSGKLFLLAHAVVNVITDDTMLIEQVLAPEWKSCKREELYCTECRNWLNNCPSAKSVRSPGPAEEPGQVSFNAIVSQLENMNIISKAYGVVLSGCLQ